MSSFRLFFNNFHWTWVELDAFIGAIALFASSNPVCVFAWLYRSSTKDAQNTKSCCWLAASNTWGSTWTISCLACQRLCSELFSKSTAGCLEHQAILRSTTSTYTGCCWTFPQWIFISLCWGNVQLLVARSQKCSCSKHKRKFYTVC